MKDWFTIGQFAQRVSLSQKALRVYEKAGLIQAQNRGENNYRYYSSQQIVTVENIKLFRTLGFTLAEIRSLLEIDVSFNPEKLIQFMEKRLLQLRAQNAQIQSSQVKIEQILSSLRKNKQGIAPQERRFIMSQLDKIGVVVAGSSGLEKTASYISNHLRRGGKEIPVTVWDGKSSLPSRKPYVLVLSEEQLHHIPSGEISPDIVVIKEVAQVSDETKKAYLKLYASVGPHMSSIMNADDRAVVDLAADRFIQQGRIYYFSKNEGLQSQIKKIGGVVSDGEEVQIYGLHSGSEGIRLQIGKILGYEDEISYLASLAAVMDLGIPLESLRESA